MSYANAKPRHLTRARIVVLTFGAALGVAIGVILIFNPCRAVAWHCRYGNEVHFANAGITLPISWWKQDGLDEGEISIGHAAIGWTDAGSLRIFPLTPQKTKADDTAAFNWQQAMLGAVSPEERKTFLPVEIHARGVQIYCVKDTVFAANNLLICRVPGISWGIGFEGPVGDEKEAESVLSSLQVSR
jgi:hypothetical protein